MASGQSGSWRTLDDVEIALVKRMKLDGMARDYIMSFFVRPGRVISPAVVGELEKKRPEISAATSEEAELFINRRLSEAAAIGARDGFKPTSSIRVREILSLTATRQGALPGFESHFAEFKTISPDGVDKVAKAKLAKTLVSFANHQGGYLFIGVSNDGELIGLPPKMNLERFWDQISDVITKNFTPFFDWERNLVEVNGREIAVAYAFQASERPIVSTSDYTNEICANQIYFRYSRSTEIIRAGDLLQMLSERARRSVAAE